ncbi:MAG TPA: RNA-binding protein [Flavisolibacter sp.]|jgi:RNA recognition motif-containing protein|nr:RNA-binding protein [Flavisolibacter sp.]
MNIHISNLSLNVMDTDIRKLFSPFGEIISAVVVRDQFNGRSKGTAFVDMISDAQGAEAVKMLHNTLIDGKKISVSEVEYRPERFKN